MHINTQTKNIYIKASPAVAYLYIFSLSPIIFFIFLVASDVASYLKDRMEGKNSNLSKREVCLGDCKKKSIDDVLVVCWSTSRYPKK